MSAEKIQTPNELLTPAAQSAVNAMITSAVKEVFQSMAPLMQSIALTPEKLRAANAPYVDPAKVAREARERQLMRDDLAEAERQKQELQAQCSHKDSNLRWSVSAIHNYPDRGVRLICVRCHKLWHPKHWEILAPDAQHPRGTPKVVEESAGYRQILADVAQQAQNV